jgi:serine/threonine-protein kinase
MAVNRVAAFLDTLRASQLLPAATVEQWGQSPLAQGDDPAPLARELVRQGYLTPYQVKQLARGGKDLTIGPYRLLELVREVGPAQVFKAVHSQMNCTVGLKVVRKDRTADAQALKREAALTVALAHPAFLRAYEAGAGDDAVYFAFEHVEGTDLERRVRESGPLPVREACDCVRQAALGVQHAHERHVVVRKIEPSRLLLTGAGVLKFLDLGSARRTRGNDESAADGLTGPPDFLAPELVSHPRTLDPRSDLYSLGCLFCYLLTGKVPASAGEASFSGCREAVPPVLQAIILKLLNRRPEDRFATAGELASALVPFSRPPSTAPAPAPVPISRPVQPPPTVTDDSPNLLELPPVAMDTAISPPVRKRNKDHSLLILGVVGVLSVGGLLVLGAALDPDLNPFARPSAPATQPQATSRTELAKVQLPELLPMPRVEAIAPAPPPRGIEFPGLPGIQLPPGGKAGDPNLKLEPKPAPKAQPRPLPVPDVIKQAEAEKLIRETYPEDYPNAKKKPAELVTAATKFLKEAGETLDNPTVQYVLYREAGDFAARGGDLDLVIRSIDEMAARFAINAGEMKIAALNRASQSLLGPTGSRALAEIGLELAGEALDEENYSTATRLLEIAEAAAKKAGSPALHTHVQKRSKDIAEIAKEYVLAREAAELLKTKPLDAEASLRWGRFQAFYKGHWGTGLPLLARGSDEALAGLAQKDQSNPDQPGAQLALADAWWETAMNLGGIAKKQVLLRARYWYEQAVPQLAGFNKTRVEKRLKDIEQMAPKDELTLERTATANVTVQEKFNKLMAAGQYYFKGGNYASAATAFAEAARLKPDDPRATPYLREARYYQFMSAGYVLANLGRYNDAAQQFQAALEQRPGDAVATAALAALEQASTGGGGPGGFFRGKGKGKN